MFIRVAIFIALLGALNFFVSSGIITRWPGAENHLAASWFMAVMFFVLQLTGMVGERTFFHKIKIRWLIRTLNWASYLAFGILSCLCAYLLVADIFTLLWLWLMPNAQTGLDYRVLVAIGAVLLITTIFGVRQALAGPMVEWVDVPLKNLPTAFDGFTIAQISDLHTGPTIGRAYTENVVRITQGLSPDLIALTGDFADGHVDALADAVAPLANLRAPSGMYFITGNHEYYWGADAWTRHIGTLGATALNDQHVVIRKDNDAIILAGVTDYSSGRSDPEKAIAGAPEGLTKILLAHQPASYKVASSAGYDLQISGHTHNGQYFPFTLLISFFQRFYKGLNRFENMFIYVNRGTGYWGPPLRTFNPAEITLLTLRAV